MIAMPAKVIGAQKRMARYYIQRLRDMNTLYKQGGRNIRHALDQYDAESNQIEQTLGWLHTHSNDDEDVADLFNDMLIAGRMIFMNRIKFSDLLPFLKNALASVEAQADIPSQLICLDIISQIYLEVNQMEEAYAYGHQLYTLAKESGHHQQTANGMYGLGLICLSSGRQAEAKHWWQDALSLYLEVRNTDRTIDSYLGLAHVALQLGEWDESQQFLDRAYASVTSEDNLKQKWLILQVMSDLKEKTGDRDAIILYRNEILEIAITLANRSDILHSHLSLAITYGAQGDFRKSQQHFRDALEIADELGMHRHRLRIWGNLGYLHYIEGDYELARDYTEKSMQTLLDGQNYYLACITMANLAPIYIHLKALDDARRVAHDGMQLAVDLENPQLQVMMIVTAVQYLVARAQSDQAQHTITTAVLWAGFVYAAPQAEEENRTELDKLRPAMVALLGDAEVDNLLAQGEALQLEAIIDDILNHKP